MEHAKPGNNVYSAPWARRCDPTPLWMKQYDEHVLDYKVKNRSLDDLLILLTEAVSTHRRRESDEAVFDWEPCDDGGELLLTIWTMETPEEAARRAERASRELDRQQRLRRNQLKNQLATAQKQLDELDAAIKQQAGQA